MWWTEVHVGRGADGTGDWEDMPGGVGGCRTRKEDDEAEDIKTKIICFYMGIELEDY